MPLEPRIIAPIEWQYDGHEFAASVDQEVDERLRVEGTTTQ